MSFYIDNVAYTLTYGSTIYLACFEKNLNLPCFCYHERLSIAGNCRICIVQIGNALGVSCAVPLTNNMYVYTSSKRVQQARQGVLEFLLMNHPLDCPICDRGGECDLQDISLTFGNDKGRFYGEKRSVLNLSSCGPLIKTIMTRCIHCTRCVRFLSELAGEPDFAIIGRGNGMEISDFLALFMHMELSSNIIDICPVGALTSMPYAFTARSWELKSVETVDVLDSFASSLRVDSTHNTIMRILPSLNRALNFDWLSNRARFTYEFLNAKKILNPKYRVNFVMVTVSWECAICVFILNLIKKWEAIYAIIGNYLSLESLLCLKSFFNYFGCSSLNIQKNELHSICGEYRVLYLLNQQLSFFEHLSTLTLFGIDLRKEAPLLLVRLNKLMKLYIRFKLFSFGTTISYDRTAFKEHYHIGSTLSELLKFFMLKSFFLRHYFTDYLHSMESYIIYYIDKAKVPFEYLKHYFLIGLSFATRKDAQGVVSVFLRFFSYFSLQLWHRCLFGVLTGWLSYQNALELSLVSNKYTWLLDYWAGAKKSFFYLLNVDKKLAFLRTNVENFVVYQCFVKNKYLYEASSLYLPVLSYFEAIGSYLTSFGLVRKATVAINPPSIYSYSDFDVLNMLFTYYRFFKTDNFSLLVNFKRTMYFLKDIINYWNCFHMINLEGTYIFILKFYRLFNGIILGIFFNIFWFIGWGLYLLKRLYGLIINYYAADFLARQSKIMSLCASKVTIRSFV